jgi:hypothetical protein
VPPIKAGLRFLGNFGVGMAFGHDNERIGFPGRIAAKDKKSRCRANGGPLQCYYNTTFQKRSSAKSFKANLQDDLGSRVAMLSSRT